MDQSQKLLTFHPEVAQALAEGKPVVALESTIISHGMPFPQNLSTASELGQIVRTHGAVPATIAVIEGKLKVGLDSDEMKMLATSNEVMKVSRFDLPFAISTKKNGATTVAATMIVADRAGISFFATGGVGGVHRGASQSFDISADLSELAQTSVAVVSAGVKAILDIPKTLEVLETLGVPVIGYKTDQFPAFYSQRSGQRLSLSMDSPSEIVAFLKAKWQLGLRGGALIANPISEKFSIDRAEIEPHIERAIAEAREKHIRGKELTPFLLQRLEEITSGRSLAANVELVKSNARLAAELAVVFNQ